MNRRGANEAEHAIEHAFDRLAPAYTAIELRKRARETRRFIQWISPRASHRVLDLASGPAVIARSLAGVARHIVALDLSFRMLNSARERRPLAPNVSLVCGTIERLPLAAGCCDLVTCAYSFANFRRPLVALREAARILAPSGRVALMEVMAPENPQERRHFNRLEAMRTRMFTRLRSYHQLVGLFEKAGFRLESAQFHRRLRRGSDWLRLSPTAAGPRRAKDLGHALARAVREGKSGLRPARGPKVSFYYQTAWLTFRLRG